MITRLLIKNFKNISEMDIEFSLGTTCLVGSNGSGKTSIFQAVGKALFQHNSMRLNDLVKEGEDNAEITLHFVSKKTGEECIIYNRFGKLASIYEAECGDEQVAGSADVSLFIKQHLLLEDNINLESLWTNSIGIPQGQFVIPFIDEPAARKRRFDILLGITEYEEVFKVLGNVRSHIASVLNTADIKINSLPTMEDYEAALSKISKAKETIKNSKRNLYELEINLERIEEVIENYKVAKAKEAHLLNMQTELKDLQLVLKVYEEIMSLDFTSYQTVEQSISEIETKLDDYFNLVSELKVERSHAKEHLSRLNKGENRKCPYCGAVKDSKWTFEEKEHLEHTCTEVDKKLEEYQNLINIEKEALKKLHNILNEVKLKHKLINLKLDKYVELTDKELFDSLYARLKQLDERVGDYTPVENLSPEINEQRDRLLQEISTNNTTIILLEEQLLGLNAELETVKANLERRKNYEKLYEAYSKKSVRLNTIRDGIRAIAPEIAKNTISIITYKAQRILDEMTGGEYDITWLPNYSIESDGRPFAKMSGGEQMMFAIALRLALTEHVSELDFVLLDEPTTHLDVTRYGHQIAKAIERIRTIPQKIVVTHDSSFDNVADKIIFIKDGAIVEEV